MRRMLDVRPVDCKSWRMIEFPDPRQADADGLLAVGGDLSPQTLLNA
ncbi:MAG: hypothetical protein Q9M25_02380 [Mariprofundaceae bacterium]|nr:hypothetical protein [Mariprofundaceae bacterium]